MKRIIISIIFNLLVSGIVIAQQQPVIKEIKIGDKIPDLILSQLINKNQPTVKISDLYKKGLLILDFWATWCAPCLREMPIADSLSAKYAGLSVLSVSEDNNKISDAFIKSHKELPNSHLWITSDSKLLNELFPHRTIPHNVWIDKYGMVKAITQGDDVKEKNIELFLSNGSLAATTKVKKESRKFNYLKPYHLEDSLFDYNKNHSFSRSVFGPSNDTLASGINYNGPLENGTSKRFFMFNGPIMRLYWSAYTYQKSVYINMNDVELHTKDSIRFYFPSLNKELFARSRYNVPGQDFDEQRTKWEDQNLFCYELTLPSFVPDSAFSRYMFEDIDRYFNITSKIETRTKLSAVLTRSDKFDSTKIVSTRIRKGIRMVTKDHVHKDGRKFEYFDITIFNIIADLNDQFKGILDYPFIDETGINYPVDMTIIFPDDMPKKVTKNDLIKVLSANGLDFKKEIRPFPTLVLYDNNPIINK